MSFFFQPKKFSTKTYVVGTNLKHVTNNEYPQIGYYEEIKKLYLVSTPLLRSSSLAEECAQYWLTA